MMTRDELDDILRQHRDFLRQLAAWVQHNPPHKEIAEEIAAFMRFVDE